MEYSHEIILPNEGFPFKMFVFEGKDGNYVRDKHWHSAIEIFAIFEGKLRFFINEEEYILEAGEFVLLNSNEVHSIFSPKPSVQDERVMELIRNMYEIYRKQECGYEFLVQSRFYRLLSLLVKEYRIEEVSPEIVRSYRKLNRLTDITNYIKENYQKELSLESLAETFGYSPTYLSKMFQKYAKINYRDYLQNIRLERAYQELVETEHMLSDIAVNHGFANSKAFAKAFQKKYQMLPSEYRKQRKEECSL